ncbi:MAG: NAD(P)/FAD-dependent oxidoreductase [Planctomycetia bacterium]|nr:NAD(P)/FAD-dependent oxidoreductase [Planctomycetia bacterium]
MAAARAAELGVQTLLLEKTKRPGTKILMSGGTRCNITHDTDNRGIVEAYGPPGRFLHSALAALGVRETIDLFEAEGVLTKVEDTGKVFPVSNRAADVLDALLRRLSRSGATSIYEEALIDLVAHPDGFRLITNRGERLARRVILTVGGQSYPGSGTTGDGYAITARLGHSIVPPRPALVPLTVDAPWVPELRGLTLPDVTLTISEEKKKLITRRGSLLFAHFGLSGPVALDVSRVVSGHTSPRRLILEIDLLPDTAESVFEESLRVESAGAGKKQLAVVLSTWLPRRLCDDVLSMAGLAVDRRGAGLSRTERAALVSAVKRLRLGLTGTLGFGRAEVTAGGISLAEVDSRDMQSRKIPGLYIAGELLDLDGPIGGYNFQAAWSTGWLAGSKAAARA